ncbi:MAG TPA: MFS transporter, partial [Chloroflexota bacterium]|nr:MFS transporter [Chloroflexota bacterium]
RRSRNGMAAVVFISFFGFNFVMPILPLYIRYLGVTDVAQAALVSGLMLAISPLTAAFFSPLWGLVADRYGRKRMVQRSLLVMTVCCVLMGMVTTPLQLFGLRAAIGVFGGFTAMAMAYLVTVTPAAHASTALGLLQAMQVGGTVVGPLCAGFVADHFGIRASFYSGAFVVFCGFLVLTLVAQDDRLFVRKTSSGSDGQVPPASEKRGAQNPLAGLASLGDAARLPGFLGVMLVMFCVQVVDRSFGPVLPLYVSSLGTPPEQVASYSGLVVSLGAVGTAVSAWVVGRLGASWPIKRLLVFTLVAGTALCFPFILVRTPQQLLVTRFLLGLFAGGTLTLGYSLANLAVPEHRKGAAFGVLSSVTLLGSASSPLAMGALTRLDLRAVFVTDAILYAAACVLALRFKRPLPPAVGDLPRTAAPATPAPH